MDSDSLDDRDLPPLPIRPRTEETLTSNGNHWNTPQDLVTRNTSNLRPRSSRTDSRVKELKDLINQLTTQLQDERRRADEAERRTDDVLVCLKSVNDARIAALHDAERAKEELKLYKVQLNTAQREIFRAQDAIHLVDRQRLQAEKDAAKARSTVRQLNEERVIQLAYEEGRRIGLQEVLNRGRNEEARMSFTASEEEDEDTEEDTSDDYRLSDRTPQPNPSSSQASAAAAAAVVSPPPIPVPPPVHPQQHFPPNEIYPQHTQASSSTSQMSHPPIPPDNYIPGLGADNVIRMPPPHNFNRATFTPEQSASTLPPAPMRTTQPNRQSSLSSNSTTLSQLDLFQDPHEMHTPMSAIPEVSTPSVHVASSNGNLRGQSSASSTRPLNISSQSLADVLEQSPSRQQGSYNRPRSTSGTSAGGSVRFSSQTPQAAPTESRSSLSTLPEISIQPPSRPASLGTLRGSESSGNRLAYTDPQNALHQRAGTPHAPSNLSGLPPSNSMPGAYMAAGPSYSDGPPVIPNIGLDSPDSPVSSSFGSDDPLRTPPPEREERKLRKEEAQARAANAWNNIMAAQNSSYGGSASQRQGAGR